MGRGWWSKGGRWWGGGGGRRGEADRVSLNLFTSRRSAICASFQPPQRVRRPSVREHKTSMYHHSVCPVVVLTESSRIKNLTSLFHPPILHQNNCIFPFSTTAAFPCQRILLSPGISSVSKFLTSQTIHLHFPPTPPNPLSTF